MRRPLTVTFAALALSLAATAANAEWQPTKPIEIVVGFSAGGGTDIIARQIAAAAQPLFPVPLVIVNKPGAAGTIAAQQVARAAPDGHTLLVAGGSESTSVPAYRDVQYDPAKDFRPILRLTKNPQFFYVSANSPFKSIADIVAKAKENPGAVSHGSSGVGSLVHATATVFGKLAGVKFKHVPYQGGGPALQALLAGQIDFNVAASDEIRGQLDAGTIRLLAVAAPERDPQYPDVPTLKELGYDFSAANMKGLVAPAGLSDEAYQYLHDRFRKAIDHEIWRDFATKGKFADGYLDGPAFQKEMVSLLETIRAAKD